MNLTNYWWLLIWLLLGYAILGRLPRQQERLDGKTVERWGCWPAFFMVLPYIIWAGFRVDFGDTYVYHRAYENAVGGVAEALKILFSDHKDSGYYAFLNLMKGILGNQKEIYFLMVAAFQALCVTMFYRKYSESFWTCIFLFVVSTDYLSWMHNGMRQFIAVCIILSGFKYLVNRKFVHMILLILLASMFHGSALLMIPIIFIIQGRAWNRKTVFFLAVTAVVIMAIDRFTPIMNDLLQETQYDDMMTNEIWTTDDGTHIIRVAVYSVPAVLSLVGLKYVRYWNDPVMNICVNCSIVTMALYLVASVSSGIYIGRLPIYTTLQGYVALPWMIDRIFEERSARQVRGVMYAAYICFFIYQMGITWKLL